MVTISLSLPDELRTYVEAAAKAGGFPSPAAFVEDLIRQNRDESWDIEELEKELEKGLNSGTPIPVDDAFWEDLRAEVRKRQEARRTA